MLAYCLTSNRISLSPRWEVLPRVDNWACHRGQREATTAPTHFLQAASARPWPSTHAENSQVPLVLFSPVTHPTLQPHLEDSDHGPHTGCYVALFLLCELLNCSVLPVRILTLILKYLHNEAAWAWAAPTTMPSFPLAPRPYGWPQAPRLQPHHPSQDCLCNKKTSPFRAKASPEMDE